VPDYSFLTGDRIVRYHAVERCSGHCPFHRPSAHLMVTWPMDVRGSTLVERVCPHGVGHPDPDSVHWLNDRGIHTAGVHGCDLCCSGLPDAVCPSCGENYGKSVLWTGQDHLTCNECGAAASPGEWWKK
jgi:hypothetical protein